MLLVYFFVFFVLFFLFFVFCVFFQAEDGIRDLVRSRGLGDVYKRQDQLPGARRARLDVLADHVALGLAVGHRRSRCHRALCGSCLLYTSDAADERSSVDLGGRRII